MCAISLPSIGQEKRILTRRRNSFTIEIYHPVSTIAMDDNSFSIYHEDYQRVTRNFLNPQHIIYPNNSFHTYDQFLSNDNTYKGKKLCID
jgi:hypothetical protein